MPVDDERVKAFYKIAHEHPEDTNLKEAYDIIVSLRKGQAQYKRWNTKQREDKKELKQEIIHLSENKQELEQQIVTISKVNDSLRFELTTINKEMEQLTDEKQKMIAERDKINTELKAIQTEVELTAIKVKETHSLYGKFTILWQFFQSVFFSDNPRDFGTINNSLPEYQDQPQMNTDQASIGRNLLDK